MSMAETDAGVGSCPSTPRLSREAVSGPARHRTASLALGMAAFVMCLLAAVGYGLVAIWFRAWGSTYVENVFPFWAWARFLHETTIPAQIYDFPLLDAYQHHIEPGYQEHLPFAYPPSFLLLLWPLGLLKVKVAYATFLAVNLIAYVAATWQRGWGRLSAGFAVMAPSTVIAVTSAQNSLLVAALLFAGCRLVARRPVLAGALFGLASFKPQFGLLVPLALISAREWQAVAAASATVLAGVIASGAVFGWSTWTAMPAALAVLGEFVSSPRFVVHSPTITAGLRVLGAGPVPVQIAQILAAALAGASVFKCFRRGFRRLPTAALMVGAFLATPYAFDYDLPILTCAVLLVCIDAKETATTLQPWEIVVLTFVIVLPYLLFIPSLLSASIHLPCGGIGLASFFALIVRRQVVAEHRSASVAVMPLSTVLG